jgi:hypothetical protein
MFGAFGTMDSNGSWDVNKVMQQRSVATPSSDATRLPPTDAIQL